MIIKIIAGIILGCSILVMLYDCYMIIRNNQVANLRVKIIDTIYSKDDYRWRVEVFDSVSYEEMLNKFWLPLKVESFYKDTSFLK